MIIQDQKQKWLLGLVFILEIFAIITQLLLMIQTNHEAGIPLGFSVGNYFSFFTVLSNTLVCMATGFPLLFSDSQPSRFFQRPSVISAITVYIFIVSLVYNLVLRGLIPLKGLNILCDELLHVINPVLFVLYWLFFVKRRTLEWKMMLNWLFFPALYLTYTLVRGSFTHWYPYPFLNVDNLGLTKVAINSLAVLAGFIITGSLLILLKKKS